MRPDRVQGASALFFLASALFFLPVRMFGQPVRGLDGLGGTEETFRQAQGDR